MYEDHEKFHEVNRIMRKYATRAVCIKKYQYENTVFDVLQIYEVELNTGNQSDNKGNSVLCVNRRGNKYGWFCVFDKEQSNEQYPVFSEHFRILK
jgi:hypothetical protein